MDKIQVELDKIQRCDSLDHLITPLKPHLDRVGQGGPFVGKGWVLLFCRGTFGQ